MYISLFLCSRWIHSVLLLIYILWNIGMLEVSELSRPPLLDECWCMSESGPNVMGGQNIVEWWWNCGSCIMPILPGLWRVSHFHVWKAHLACFSSYVRQAKAICPTRTRVVAPSNQVGWYGFVTWCLDWTIKLFPAAEGTTSGCGPLVCMASKSPRDLCQQVPFLMRIWDMFKVVTDMSGIWWSGRRWKVSSSQTSIVPLREKHPFV